MMSFSSQPQHRRIASNLLLRGGELIPNPLVEVDSDGRIVSIESVDRSVIDGCEGTEFYSGIMMAGFINAHCHLELSYLHGAIDPGGGFDRFASKIGEVRDLFSEEERMRALRRADAEMLREGIVAVGDICNGVTSFAVKERSSIRYRSFAELFGLSTQDTLAIDPILSFHNTSITPHSTYSLSDEIFRTITHHGDSPLSIHFMESPAEAELFHLKGRLWEWYQRRDFKCDFLHYGSPAERLVSSTPRDRSVMLIHNCCVTQRDIDTIMEHFTAPVYWVLCPKSNRYISNLKPDTNLLRRNGLNICVGTDSLSSNWSLSILEELREMQDTPLVERLDWATRIGAQALKMDDLGDIEVGRCPGINILSGINYSTMELSDQSQIERVL